MHFLGACQAVERSSTSPSFPGTQPQRGEKLSPAEVSGSAARPSWEGRCWCFTAWIMQLALPLSQLLHPGTLPFVQGQGRTVVSRRYKWWGHCPRGQQDNQMGEERSPSTRPPGLPSHLQSPLRLAGQLPFSLGLTALIDLRVS